MKFVGVNIGALTVKIVAIQGEDKFPRVVAHRGRPLQVVQELIPARSSLTPTISASLAISSISPSAPPEAVSFSSDPIFLVKKTKH
jgi:hypothetical protein